MRRVLVVPLKSRFGVHLRGSGDRRVRVVPAEQMVNCTAQARRLTELLRDFHDLERVMSRSDETNLA